jgi:hypothetical protein
MLVAACIRYYECTANHGHNLGHLLLGAGCYGNRCTAVVHPGWRGRHSPHWLQVNMTSLVLRPPSVAFRGMRTVLEASS